MTPEQPRDIASWRREYEDHGLTEDDLEPDPLVAFTRWLAAADLAGLHEPNAMIVSTVAGGAPSSRMVLLKTVDERGFVFYTNYRSRKAVELAANPACGLLFPWHPLERQVRVEGLAERIADDESDAYFASRPRGAQIGAWASPQSEVVSSREFLEQCYVRESDRFAVVDVVPRPPYWGGYLVRPHLVEFWQGRPGRMHDRLRFERSGGASPDTARDGAPTWVVERLAP